MNPSPEYQRALAEATAHHASSKTYSGKFLRPHAPFIKRLIDEYGSPVLDYGCGKGSQYEWISHGDEASIPKGQTIEQFWGVPVRKYDPAWPPFATDPENLNLAALFTGPPYGVTIVTHVLGSIPIGDLLGWVMPRIRGLTNGAVYVAEKLGDVRKDVFSETGTLPRWGEADWRGFMLGQSLTDPDLQFVLSLRRRAGDQTLVDRWSYRDGAEQPWT